MKAAGAGCIEAELGRGVELELSLGDLGFMIGCFDAISRVADDEAALRRDPDCARLMERLRGLFLDYLEDGTTGAPGPLSPR